MNKYKTILIIILCLKLNMSQIQTQKLENESHSEQQDVIYNKFILYINDSIPVHIEEFKDRIIIDSFTYATFQKTFIHKGDTLDIYINCGNYKYECSLWKREIEYAVNYSWMMDKKINFIDILYDAPQVYSRNVLYFNFDKLKFNVIAQASPYHMTFDNETKYCHCNESKLYALNECDIVEENCDVDIIEVLIHEFGHTFSLGHCPSSPQSIMYNFTKLDHTVNDHDFSMLNFYRLKDDNYKISTFDDILVYENLDIQDNLQNLIQFIF